MTPWISWLIMIVAGYLLGSVPASFLAAKARGIDLRKQGTGQVGGGNLWRTTSRKLGLLVGIFDFAKGIIMIWIGQFQGLDVGQQLVVGLAVIIGHNWPVFLRFHGGRGIATTLGLIIFLPAINANMSVWPTTVFWIILVAGVIPTRKTPIPILIGVASLPVTSWIVGEPLPVTTGFLSIFLVIVIKRLIAQPSTRAKNVGVGRLLVNRLFLDRDIADRNTWVSRKPVSPQEILEDLVDTDEMRDSSEN